MKELIITLVEYSSSLCTKRDTKLICHLLTEATSIARELGNCDLFYGVVEVYSRVLADVGRRGEAEAILKEALALAEEGNEPQKTVKILELQLSILWDERNADKLIKIYDRLETVASAIGYRLSDQELGLFEKLIGYRYQRLREWGELRAALELLSLPERVFRRHEDYARLTPAGGSH